MTDAGSHRVGRRRLIIIATACGVLALVAISVRARWNAPSLSRIQAVVDRGDFTAAGTMIDAYVGQYPRDLEGWTLQARVAGATGDQRKAAEAYLRQMELSPRKLSLRQRYATALQESAQIMRAEEAYREILRIEPTDESAQTQLQWMLFYQLRERELEELLESCLEREPASFRLLYHLLVSSQKRPTPQASLPVLKRIDEACPDQPAILLALARCAWKLDEIPQARLLFERWRTLAEPDQEFALALAEFEFEQLNLDGVEAALASVPQLTLAQWQQNDRWWWLQSQIAQHRRELETALAAAAEAQRLYPRSLTYLHACGTLSKLVGKTEEAAALEAEVDIRRAADRRLYVLVHGGELERPTPAVMGEISDLCRVQSKTWQADGWRQLSEGKR